MKDGRRVTVKDIAQEMNVSLSTVNKALTGKSGVSEKRRAEIVATAKELGYEVNHIAQALSRAMIRIGIVIPSLWREYHGVIEEGMRMELGRLAQNKVEGVFKHINHSAEIETAFTELYDEGVDIIVYCPSIFEVSESVKTLAKNGKVPIFVVGDSFSGLPGVCSILLNSKISAYMAADMLSLTAAKGGDAAVFVGSMKLESHREKARAFCERAKELGFSDAVVYETLDDISVIGKSLSDMAHNHPNVKGIYVASAVISPIVDYLEKLAPCERPSVVATDVYDEVREAVKRNYVCATIFQNQKLIGRLSMRKAYDYIVRKMSYSASDDVFAGDIYVTPQLFLPSRIDEFKFDGEDDHMLEYN